MTNSKPPSPTTKSIALLGPTSSGKSDIAIALAQDFSGEIISVDSRQVYQFMDVGSGKVTPKEQTLAPHHLLDVVHPNDEYNIALFLRDAKQVQAEICARDHVPILCGGTGFWMQAFVEDQRLPEVPPNATFRKSLETLKTNELYELLQKKDPSRAEALHPENRSHLVRALEVVDTLGSVPPLATPNYATIQEQWLILALMPERELLYKRIDERMERRVASGMLKETEGLHSKHLVSWKRLESFGLEYKHTAKHLQEKIDYETMIEHMKQDDRNYAKRQITWIRRWERAGAPITRVTDLSEARTAVADFLSS